MARVRMSVPRSAVIKTADEIRTEIATLPDAEKQAAEAALQEAMRIQAERQAKYDRELT